MIMAWEGNISMGLLKFKGVMLNVGNADIVEELSNHKANASLPATGGVTALHAAAELGDLPTVQALLKVLLPLHGIRNHDFRCCCHGDTQTKSFLCLLRNLSWSAKLVGWYVDSLLQSIQVINTVKSHSQSILLSVWMKALDCTDSVRQFLCFKQHVQPLQHASSQAQVSVLVFHVRWICQAGADPNATDTDSEAKPIHAAAFSGHTMVVEELLPVTHPRKGEQWTVESLMAETSSSGSMVSPESADRVTSWSNYWHDNVSANYENVSSSLRIKTYILLTHTCKDKGLHSLHCRLRRLLSAKTTIQSWQHNVSRKGMLPLQGKTSARRNALIPRRWVMTAKITWFGLTGVQQGSGRGTLREHLQMQDTPENSIQNTSRSVFKSLLCWPTRPLRSSQPSWHGLNGVRFEAFTFWRLRPVHVFWCTRVEERDTSTQRHAL